MDMKFIALHLWPSWLLGLSMLGVTLKSKFKELVRVEKQPMIEFGKFLCQITLFRVLTFGILTQFPMFKNQYHTIASIPWEATLFTFWEDMVHGLPLIMLKKMLGDKWYHKLFYKLAFALTIFSFGIGHLYQGVFAAAMISFYIPFSIEKGEKYGIGTVCLCHMAFDLATVLTARIMLGHM